MDFQGLLETEGPENSAAAVHGGDTTVVDFAIMEPPRSLHDTIALKQERLQGNMAVDYGLHAILTGEFSFENIEEVGDVIRSGIPTIKTMMTYGWMSDDGRRYGVMCGDRGARRDERRARRGRRDRELADGQVRARGQDPRRPHLRGARPAGGGGGHTASAVPRRARRLTAVRPPHGGRIGDRGAGRVPRARTADVRRDADHLPELHPGRPVGRDSDRGRRARRTRAGRSTTTTRRRSSGPTATPAGRRSPTIGSRRWAPTTAWSSSRTVTR